MKTLLIATVVSIVLIQCTKSPFNDLSGAATLNGVALVYDTLSGLTSPTPLKNAKIFLRYQDNPNSFLYSNTSNEAGQYKFSGINLDRSYFVYATVDTGTVKYEGQLGYSANGYADGQSDTLKLYPAPGNQNGIHVIVQDSAGGRVANITAWVFNSRVLFAADTIAGKVFDMVTNAGGVANKYNATPGRYYFRVKTRIGNMDLVAEDSVQLASTGIKTVMLTLRKPSSRNGVELTVLDRFGTPVSNAISYFYRSRIVFIADTASYSQSIFRIASNSSGLAAAYGIDSAMYYYRTIKVLNTDTLKRMDSIHVNKNTVSEKTFVIQ